MVVQKQQAFHVTEKIKIIYKIQVKENLLKRRNHIGGIWKDQYRVEYVCAGYVNIIFNVVYTMILKI